MPLAAHHVFELTSRRRPGVMGRPTATTRSVMSQSYKTLLVEIDASRIATITMNRPQALNAMNTRMMQEVRDCFTGFHIDQDAASCIILTGAGNRGFCTGADLKERKGMD